MKTIIVGAGKVGFILASVLSGEGYEVTVIDTNARRLEILASSLDIKTVEGNGARLATLEKADIREADLFFAVTEKDELNMVACFAAKNVGAKNTVARVRDPEYSDFDDESRMEALGIDLIINPEKVSAEEAYKHICFPEAHYVGYFGGGRALILELSLPDTCPHFGMPFKDISLPQPCLIIAIERDDELIIPHGSSTLLPNDTILVLANTQKMREVEQYLGIELPQVDQVTIFGGELSGFYLATLLEKSRRYDVKLIDNNLERCEDIAQTLRETVVINNSASDIQLFEDENIGLSDVFCAMTDNDKQNLFVCLLAKSLGVKKTIAQLREGSLVPMAEKTGLDKAISPRSLTADAILRFINRNRILSLTRFEDGMGQLTEFMIAENSRAAGLMVMELRFPKQAIICMILRDNEVIIPGGRDYIQAGDKILVFAQPHKLREVEKIFNATK